MRYAALVLVALALSGCETTAEKSAKLERAALKAPGHGKVAAQKGLVIAHPSTNVKVVKATVLHDSEGSVAAVTLRNPSDKTLASVPIAIAVKDAAGTTVYTNATPGLAHSLVAVPLLAPHSQLTWVDDQVQGSGTPASVTAEVGETPASSASVPSIALAGTHSFEDPTSGSGVEGTVANRSGVSQTELVVYATVSRGGKIVAAGRAVLSNLAAGASSRYQIFYIGNPAGGKLALSAPASTLG